MGDVELPEELQDDLRSAWHRYIDRLEERDGRIARIRGYAFCPETIRTIGEALGLKVRTGLYRFPTPAPGKLWEG